MLDVPGHPLLDKAALIGGCVRLPLTVDADRLRGEIAALPDSLWGTRGGRVGVHQVAEALFLRGFAPAEGEKPVADRPALDLLPYARFVIEQVLPAAPLRCLLARLPAGATIAPHTDLPPYFSKTLRIHVPVETNASVHMMAGGLCYSMQTGEVWVLNNSATHAVWNAHPTLSRTHLICDFLPSPALRELLRSGERSLGTHLAHVDQYFKDTRHAKAAGGR
jgi:Aspartyl/Asparaginyl beta-hydroxylase